MKSKKTCRTAATKKPAPRSRSTKSTSTKIKAQHYTVWDGTRGGKTFKNYDEAAGYCNDIFHKKGEIVGMTATDKQVTHSYSLRTNKK